jgi:hypothetical protein
MSNIKLTEAQRAKVCALYLEGLYQKEIAERFRMSPAAIGKILRDNKIKPRPKANRDFCVNGHEMKDPNILYTNVIQSGETYKRRQCKTCSHARRKKNEALQRKKALLLGRFIAESSNRHLFCVNCDSMLEEWLSKKLSGK